MHNKKKAANPPKGNISAKGRGSYGLGFLVYFLNAQSADAFLEGLDDYEAQAFGSDWIKEAWRIREEIVEDLKPLIERVSTDKAIKGLNSLIDKINGLCLTPRWQSWPARARLFTVRSRRETKEISVKNPVWAKLGPGQGAIKIGKQKMIVTTTFSDHDPPLEFLYSLIASALQSGALKRLRRCHWKECQKLFIRDLRHKEYCTKKCAGAAWLWYGGLRVREWRRQQKESE